MSACSRVDVSSIPKSFASDQNLDFSSSSKSSDVFQRTLSTGCMSRKRKSSSGFSDFASQNPERALKQIKISSISSSSESFEENPVKTLESQMCAWHNNRTLSKQHLDLVINYCCKTYAEIIENLPQKIPSSIQKHLLQINRYWSNLIERRKQAFFAANSHLSQLLSDDAFSKVIESTTRIYLSHIKALYSEDRIQRKNLEKIKHRFQSFLAQSSAQILNMKSDNCFKACDQFDKKHKKIHQMVIKINECLTNSPNQQFFRFEPAPRQSLQSRSHRST